MSNKKYILIALAVMFFGLFGVSMAQIGGGGIGSATLWYLDGTTLKPVDSSWTVDAAISDLSCTDCLNATEIEDIYLLNSGDTSTGALTINDNNGSASTLLTIGDANDLDNVVINGDISILGNNIEATTETDRFVFMANGSTYAPEAIDLGTDTTGFYALSDSEGGNALDVTCTNCLTTTEVASADLATLATTVTVSESSDASSSIAMFDSATGSLDPRTDLGLTYNASTANLSTTTFTGALTGNASTASALASDPTDCSSNQFANAIATSGNLTCAAIGDADVPNTITIDLATLATTGTVSDAGSDTTTFPMIAIDLTGSLGSRTDAGLTYNANTNALSTTTFIGALTGNASTASDLSGCSDCINATEIEDIYLLNGGDTATGLLVAGANFNISNGATSSGILKILEDSDAGSNFATFQVPALGADTVYVLPADDGDATEQLTTDGDGNLSWEAAGSGSGAPTDADYLVGTANGGLSAEIVVGTSPGGELGNTWASPTIDADAVLWNEVGDSGADATIAMGANETDFTSTIDAAGEAVFTITNTDADASNDNTLLTLSHNDGADVNVFYLSTIADADGTPLTTFSLQQNATVGAISLNVGSAGVKISDDGDGALEFLGQSTGSDECIALNMDDTSNQAVFVNCASSTSVTDVTFSGLDITVGGGNINTGNIALVVGDATTDTITLTTDGTGTGEVVLPDESISTAEITNGTITTTDISGSAGITLAQTAMTAGRSLTIATNDVAADAELYTDTKCIYWENPSAADDFKSIWRSKIASTITSIWAESDQTVTFMLQVDDGSAADVDSVDLAPAAGTAEDTSLDGDATLAAGDRLDMAVTSVANTPTWVSVCWTFTYDD